MAPLANQMGSAAETPLTARTRSAASSGSDDTDMCIVRTPLWDTMTSAELCLMYAVTCVIAPAKIPSRTSTRRKATAMAAVAMAARRRSAKTYRRAMGTRPFMSGSERQPPDPTC